MLDLKKERYLLALSGGSDSMYLFHQLLDGKYDFAVAHVDHGWRETSKEEALWLKEYCEARGITFYGHKLDRVLGEDEARRARLAFFRSIEGFDAVLMAHHADDQVETILKRLFEGSSNLRGFLI